MYALGLPTIAQVSLVARFRGKQPIWWPAARLRAVVARCLARHGHGEE
jgi:hypothetical protein